MNFSKTTLCLIAISVLFLLVLSDASIWVQATSSSSPSTSSLTNQQISVPLVSNISSTNKKPNTPIKHIIIITQENHSFDNYFGTFPGLAGGYGLNSTICVPFNPNIPSLGCLHPFDIDNPPGQAQTMGLSHSWNTSHVAYDNGSMNGFIYAQTLIGGRQGSNANYTMGYYTSATIPNYWDYASYYALDANFFSSQLSYTYPNRLYEVAARSNDPLNGSDDPVLFNLTYPTIINQLTQVGISWKYYSGNWNDSWDCKPFDTNLPIKNGIYKGWDDYYSDLVDFPAIQLTKPECRNLQNQYDLMNDIKSGKLPEVAWVNPNTTTSEHPGDAATLPTGQLYVSSIINAISENATLWKSTAIFITYDEFGGYYDQVPPMQVDQYGYGFRVPLMVISPYVKPGIYYGSPTGTEEDLSAFLSTIEANWGLQNLTMRDGVDAPLWYMFNFTQKPLPPLILPANTLATYPWQSCVSSSLCQVGAGRNPVFVPDPPSYQYPGVLSPEAAANGSNWNDPGD